MTSKPSKSPSSVKKKYYLILGKKSNFIYGAFPRTKEGKEEAQKYKVSLKDKRDKVFVIK